MPESSARCERCGAASRTDKGICLNCLLLEGLDAPGEPSLETFENVLAEVDLPDGGWRLGNYEILEEIGRGGMGVIYRARQRHSRRIVAVKRMLSYEAESHETLARFRREAETVASLDHPNILPIYEVSESEDGIPFFSMKLAMGGSLRAAAPALIAEPKECVRLMEKVARALDYAHERGILHRDLQPGNILLDARGEPMISDFGLAKWLNGNSDLTQTLTAFGTPGYIAPEQAAGAGELTSVGDIYSLGAIMFFLFTGRPPFVGANALSVLRQAGTTDAPALRSLVPSLDRDLETIVAHCLEREPGARYQTAGDLADDMARWLAGRPIVARPLSRVARLWRLARRQPVAAAATAGCAILALAVAWLVHPLWTAAAPEKSIAVLPFENRSDDNANTYFTESIQDEILTRLSKMAELKVISRTSTQHYKSAPENVSAIARELGVAHILKGSVQKNGDAVRVNVHLIKARNNSDLWGETFDRKLNDIFSVESEVAKAIADQLRIKLTGREEQIIDAKPTENPEAYDAYLRGLAYTLKSAPTSANVLGAQKHLKEATALDPKFALSWALLSMVDARSYLTQGLPPTAALREEARQAAETALILQPQLGEAILAKGFYHYACLKDYDTAVRYLERARQILPNNSRIPESLAYVERRRGHWDQSEAHLLEAERLDPRNVSLLTGYATNYLCLRRFPEALRKLEQILNIIPDDLDTLAAKARIAQAQGDLARADTLLAPLRPSVADSGALEIQLYQAILERRPQGMIARLKEILGAQPDPTQGLATGELRFWLGWAQEIAGDQAASQESWRQARSELEPLLKEQPDNYSLLGDLALVSMGLGDKSSAFAFAERAMAANPIDKDAVRGPVPLEILARVAARLGESDRALAALQKLLALPYDGAMAVGPPLTPALLRLDPMFDPLRNDPRFQQLAR